MSASVTWLGHATVLIEIDGTRLLTDPVIGRRVGPLVRIAPAVDDGALDRLDAVLLSHLHGDHLDLRSLRRVARTVPIIAPRPAARWLARHGFGDVRELQAGEETTTGALRVVAVPAEHAAKRWPWGPAAEAVGYVARGSRAVYFAGDTDLFDEMATLKGTVDMALLPVAGWGPTLGPGHLDARRAAEAARRIAPRMAMPIHWGTLALPRPLKRPLDPERSAREFAEFASRLAPGVEVRVLAPGQHTSF